YHTGGLWTNTCFGHPRPAESTVHVARRRLREEMGIACPLVPLFATSYRAAVGNGLTEHEMVHVFGGLYTGPVAPNPQEADGFAWAPPEELREDVARVPERYSVWFRLYLDSHWQELIAVA
ncbi:MAG: isopentenyl-diphosphate Delta-isomerase, partial [Hyphomicrobiaceae bacterium]